jgi:hypothetical protein
MMIQSGDLRSIQGKPWVAIEFSGSKVDEIVRRIVCWARSSVPAGPFQLLFPVKSRNPDGVQLLSPYLWARTKNLSHLQAVKSVHGVEGLVTGPDGKFIEADDWFVQDLIQRTKAYAEARHSGIGEGTFVRILFGPQRMLCGTVEGKPNGVAKVVIALRSRQLKVFVPVYALENLRTEPKEYFYKESQ